MADITQRCRKGCSVKHEVDEPAIDELLDDAADEIDRLRDVVRELRDRRYITFPANDALFTQAYIDKRRADYDAETERLCKGESDG